MTDKTDTAQSRNTTNPDVLVTPLHRFSVARADLEAAEVALRSAIHRRPGHAAVTEHVKRFRECTAKVLEAGVAVADAWTQETIRASWEPRTKGGA